MTRGRWSVLLMMRLLSSSRLQGQDKLQLKKLSSQETSHRWTSHSLVAVVCHLRGGELVLQQQSSLLHRRTSHREAGSRPRREGKLVLCCRMTRRTMMRTMTRVRMTMTTLMKSLRNWAGPTTKTETGASKFQPTLEDKCQHFSLTFSCCSSRL